MSVTVRPVRPEEHAAVGRLTLAAYDELGAVSSSYRDVLADVAGRIDGDTSVLVAVEDGQVLGSVTIVSACSEHFEHVGHGDGGFRMLAVDPAAQGRGVGRALLDAAIAHGRDAGWRRLAITSMGWMAAAHAMYERAGFVHRGDLDVRFASGVGRCFVLDLSPDAAAHFPAPGPTPEDPPLFDPHQRRAPGC